MECHPRSPTSYSVVDYSPIYLKGGKIINLPEMYTDVYMDYYTPYLYTFTMKILKFKVLSTISYWGTLPLVVVLEVLSTISSGIREGGNACVQCFTGATTNHI